MEKTNPPASQVRQRLKEILQTNSITHGNFTLASGLKSSYYIDGKMTTFDAEGAYLVGLMMIDEIKKLDLKIDSVGGPTMGADPIVTGVGIASHLQSEPLRIFAVRKETKEHGAQKMIEGNFKEGDKVVIVEDVITTGGSIFQAIKAVEDSKGTVEAVIVIVDRMQGGKENMEEKGYKFRSLFEINELL